MQKQKIKVCILGTGNIGTDILLKLKRSEVLECGMFAGRNPDSNGIRLAQSMGIPTSSESIEAIRRDPECCEIVFDATTASAHQFHAPILKDLHKFTIDLTPSQIGKMCVPALNLDQCLEESNVNLITCGGQAVVPIAHAISKLYPDTKYFEMVATIASKSAGPGTRKNIDEFTQTTREALVRFTGVENSKAIIILNPAEPPITMHNTLYALVEQPVDLSAVRKSVHEMEQTIKKYIPGYKIVMEPTYENGRLTTTLQVVGLGDYLPKYSGNLDIITCAAIEVAEKYAYKKLLGERV